MSMKLVIMRPGEMAEYAVEWIEINTPLGNFVIQEEHAPTVFTLSAHKECRFSLAITGKEESLVIEEGIIEINRKTALLFLSNPA
jgi:F0F1-type ATP synthase epsilon subunit